MLYYKSIIKINKFNPLVFFQPPGSTYWTLVWLLKFHALLDASTNTRALSTVSRLLPTNLSDLGKLNDLVNC